MNSEVILATHCSDITPYRQLSTGKGYGLELQAFFDPQVLAGDWRRVLDEHQRALAGFEGTIGMHGAFFDLNSGSLDPAINAVVRLRLRQNLNIARKLRAKYIVFHANYLSMFKVPYYRQYWHERQVDFWQEIVEEAAAARVHILLENVAEDDPTILTDLLAEVNNPFFGACLDVAHTFLYSKRSIYTWIDALAPYLYVCHLNNHDGKLDQHWPLSQGVIDYDPILSYLSQLLYPPKLTLEVPNQAAMKQSLNYLTECLVPV